MAIMSRNDFYNLMDSLGEQLYAASDAYEVAKARVADMEFFADQADEIEPDRVPMSSAISRLDTAAVNLIDAGKAMREVIGYLPVLPFPIRPTPHPPVVLVWRASDPLPPSAPVLDGPAWPMCELDWLGKVIDNFLFRSIEELDITNGAVHKLHRAGIFAVGQLAVIRKKHLLKLNDIGRGTVDQVMDAFALEGMYPDCLFDDEWDDGLKVSPRFAVHESGQMFGVVKVHYLQDGMHHR
jgi:hypothetical protein